MKRYINLTEVTDREPLEVSTRIEPSVMELPEAEVKSATPFDIHIKVQKGAIGYRVSGRISGTVKLLCSRCLKEIEERIDREFSYRLLPTSRIGKGKISAEELDIKFSDSQFIDLAEVVREQILLTIPVKPLCSEACSVSYSEEGEEVDERWEKLKFLREKLGNKE